LRQWRAAAKALALLALLANAALLSASHQIGGITLSTLAGTAQHHHHIGGHGEDRPASSAHQVCHFCRLLGAALPPPPSTVIEIVTLSRIVEWPAADWLIRRQEPPRTTHRPRAPPAQA
jgi:hypothetical protein